MSMGANLLAGYVCSRRGSYLFVAERAESVIVAYRAQVLAHKAKVSVEKLPIVFRDHFLWR